jgi:Tol biopolymer transport system component
MPGISTDGLSLFFDSGRSGGYGNTDIYITTRDTKEDEWGPPVNIGPTVNSSYNDNAPSISADGLELFFHSSRPGGIGDQDIWVATRATTEDDWEPAINLGSTVNSSSFDAGACISTDGLSLFFMSWRNGGYGDIDVWLTTRSTKEDPWGESVNIGPSVNLSYRDATPFISADGSTLFFSSQRPGEYGSSDIWQASMDPIVDLNIDGIVDAADMCVIVNNWGTDNPLCDIGPMPWGDGIVDVQDLIILAEHLFEEVQPNE